MANTRHVSVPDSLAERIEGRLSHTEFDTVDEYVAYVLAVVLEEVESEVAPESGDEVDERAVRDRLESLGYLES